MLRSQLVALMLWLMVLGSGIVSAQDYPSKPVRIVTAGAGGGSDFMARQIAQGIAGPLGQQVIVDNRGSGIILNEILAKTPPDGYGLVLTGASFWVGLLLQKAPYDVERDYAPISLLSREVFVAAVHPSLPVKSIKELIALAKAKAGELNYASIVPGGPPHLAGELFKSAAGVNIVNVPYKATGVAITSLMSGEVQLMFTDPNVALPHAKVGKLRALAVTSAQPTALVPGMPTVAASGLPGYEYVGMTGIWAPAKTPATIINRLNQEIVRFLNQPDAKERFLKVGVETVGSSPEQFAATIRSDIAKMGKVIKDAGIKVE